MDVEVEKKKEVIMDFEGAIAIMKSRGRDTNLRKVSEEIGYTVMGLGNLRKSAPKPVQMLFHFLKDNMLEFGDVVKEVESKK
jgi:hypothetical protein